MELFEKASELKRYNIPFALVTLLETSGTAPRSEGRMIVTLDGKIFGTVGGGAMEKAASDEALLALKENKGRRVKLPVRKDGMAEFGRKRVLSRFLQITNRTFISLRKKQGCGCQASCCGWFCRRSLSTRGAILRAGH